MRIVLAALFVSTTAIAQATPPAGQAPATRVDSVVTPISAPATPLPPEAQTANVTRFSFIAYGDTRGRRDGLELQMEHGRVMDEMLATIARMKNGPDPVKFVIQSGDAVVNGQSAGQLNVSYIPLINRVTTQAGIPYYLAPGNHDVTSSMDLKSPGRLAGLRNYFAAQANLIPSEGSPRRLKGYPAYAFAYGNTFFLALDSNISDDSTQIAWAKAQLAGVDRRRYAHIVGFFHHPAYSSGPHGGIAQEKATLALREKWMPLFRKYNVDMLFTGHEHFFEHWVERWRDSTGRAHRMDQIVSGGGGAPLYTYMGEPDLAAYRLAGGRDSVRVEHLVKPGLTAGENPYHFVVVHVDGPRVWHEVIGVDWGRGFAPYKSARAAYSDSTRPPER